MNVTVNLQVALRALTRSKLRSALTMLGIVIGISAVITLVSVGQGVQAVVAEEMEGIGSNLLFVLPGELGANQSSVKSNFIRSANLSTLTLGDALALNDPVRVPDVAAVTPEFVAVGTVVRGNSNTQTSISGVIPVYAMVRDFYPIAGRFIEERDLQANARVAVLGQTTMEALFSPGINPIGQTIKINRVPFRVIGVMEERGGTSFSDEDDVVFIPLTTAHTRLFGGRTVAGDYGVSVIYAQAIDEDRMEGARAQITRVLRQRHRLIYSTDNNDFSVLTQSDVSAVLGSLTAILTAFLGLIAAVSLLVGGIGIMNIMLVSVTERTREIGLRKAVGAKRRHILGQFLIEAMVLSLLGGVMGIALGATGSLVASIAIEGLNMYTSPKSMAIATAFSAAVGLFFGIYPAYRASRLNPIDALRYE
jgi:putative ABC transport system permease protein